MSDGRILLVDVLEKNGGAQAFSKGSDQRLLQILAEMEREGKVESVPEAETETEVTYRVRERRLVGV